MEKILENKVAVITGGTRGIGKAIAKRFIESGAHVALFGTSPENGRQAVEALTAFGSSSQKILFYPVDVAHSGTVDEAIQSVFADLGSVDILVNNAGITKDNLLMRLTEGDWEAVMNTNLKSIYNTCRSVVRPMIKSRQGKIINITSIVGLTGNPGQTNYAASKSGMIGFTKSLAKEIASKGISVNCIAPGFIQTDMTGRLNDKQRELILSQIPMQKMGEPEDIANAALFLAGPYANYITGQVITVDGGMVM